MNEDYIVAGDKGSALLIDRKKADIISRLKIGESSRGNSNKNLTT